MRKRRGFALVVAVLALAGAACAEEKKPAKPTAFDITGNVLNADPRARAIQDPTKSDITGLIVVREGVSNGFEECTADVSGVSVFVKKQTTYDPKDASDLTKLRGITVFVRGRLTKGDNDICTPIADSLIVPASKTPKPTPEN